MSANDNPNAGEKCDDETVGAPLSVAEVDPPVPTGIRRDGHLLFEVEMYLQKGCIMVSGVGSS